MKSKTFSAVVLAAFLVMAAGCGDKKTEIPKDLNQKLPPAPVAAGGAPAPVKGMGKEANPSAKAD